MSIPSDFPRELLPEFNRFRTDQIYGLRHKWCDYGGDTDRTKHIRFCRAAAIKLTTDPRVVHIMLKHRYWHDYKVHRHGATKRSTLFAQRETTCIDPIKLVRNGNIDIPKHVWDDLNRQFTRDEIKTAIIRAIRDHNVPVPTKNLTQHDADKAFRALLALPAKQTVVRIKGTCTRWNYKPEYWLSDVVLTAPIVGNESSDFYHQANRFKVGSEITPGPYTTWHNDTVLKRTLTNLWTMERPGINRSVLRDMIALRRYIASQFKPSAAKALYSLFNSRRVYDPSSGWGDRLSGFLATAGTHYYSTDPNTALYDGYDAQVARYGRGQTVSMYDHGSEVPGGIKQYGHVVDTVFTSPPYFGAEKYSTDEGQSYKQFDNAAAWNKGFLFPTIRNAWDVLMHNGDRKRGGILAMNISDVFDNRRGERARLCDPMNDYIATLPGARYVGCIGLTLAKRPNSAQLIGKSGVMVEPIWLWAKGGTHTLDDYLREGFKDSSVVKRRSLFQRR